MKTDVFKNSELIKSAKSVLLVSMTIFCGILLFAFNNNKQQFFGNDSLNAQLNPNHNNPLNNQNLLSGSVEPKKTSAELLSLSFVIPIHEITFSKTSLLELEKEKLLMKIKLTEESLNREKEAIKNTASAVEISMEKLHDYLIPENEPEIEANFTNSIVFPDAEIVELTEQDYTLSASGFLKDLQNQANKKTSDAVEYYAFEKKIRACLITEVEPPLMLEDWMTNEKCWCPELRGVMALTEEKQPLSIKQ